KAIRYHNRAIANDLRIPRNLIGFSTSNQDAGCYPGVNPNSCNGGDRYHPLYIFPAIILLILGATIISYGLFCCPTFLGVLLILLAGIPICTAVWLFFFRVLPHEH